MYPIALLHCIITDIENHRLNKLLHLSTHGNIPRKTPVLHVPAGGKVLIFYSEFNFSFFPRIILFHGFLAGAVYFLSLIFASSNSARGIR